MKHPRTYQNWIKKSESFTPFNGVIKTTKFVIVVNSPLLTDSQLEKILISITKQSYQNWQVVVVLHDTQTVADIFTNTLNITTLKVECSELMQPFNIKYSGYWALYINYYLVLAPQALWEFAVYINADKSSKSGCIYSDHDYIDREGKRHNVKFKPDWNADLYYEQEYIANCCVIQVDSVLHDITLNQLSSRSEMFGLIINIDNHNRATKIEHLAKVLFHLVDGPLELNSLESQKALQQRFNLDLKVEPTTWGQKLTWPIMKPEPLVSLIIPTRNGLDILKQAIDSILAKTTYENYEIIIVDNQSDDIETINYLKSIGNSKINVINYNHPFNYSAINNFAAEHAQGTIIGLINNDVEVISPQWLTEMVSHAIRPDIGCVGAKLYYPNDTIQHAGVIIGIWGCAGHSHKYYPRSADGFNNRLQLVQNYSAVTAACLLVKKELFNQVSGLNERDLTVAFNDVDFCLKVERLGVRNLWTPYAELYHYESISRGDDATPEKRARAEKEINYMHDTWGTNTYLDPAYNPNLTLKLEDFSISRDI
ncbi:glycosyltransferase family 2 protein [Thalassotalea psychrophila]|uniref:Glycosyltransferase family 2 protein n=1 Tax=Thalassotalea psychrophila TaxID=3065647 RepID=A0ABY9TR81_9GAMM|nr:glycosyltransferase family 2 protein [Colwelliaceae bacterium SQ149]